LWCHYSVTVIVTAQARDYAGRNRWCGGIAAAGVASTD
jgi:hypothetical protein